MRGLPRLREVAEAMLVAVLLAGYARTFLAQPFSIPSASMAPSLAPRPALVTVRQRPTL